MKIISTRLEDSKLQILSRKELIHFFGSQRISMNGGLVDRDGYIFPKKL